MKHSLSFIIIYNLYQTIFGKGEMIEDDICRNYKSSEEACVSFSGCSWCPDENMINICVSNFSSTFECKNSSYIIDKSTFEVSDTNADFNVYPSDIDAVLELNTIENFEIKIEFKNKSSIDLYFLFDLIGFDNIKLQKFINILTEFSDEFISNTTNFIGFGYFSDKPTPPFNLQKNFNSSISRSFENIISLTDNRTIFNNKLINTKSRNMNTRSAIFDSIHQAARCSEFIGWRNGSVDKIIVVVTESSSRTSGDGRAAAIIRPLNNECYLDQSNSYINDTDYDYASFHALEQALISKNLKILFMSTELNEEYKKLKQIIKYPLIEYSKIIEDSVSLNQKISEISKKSIVDIDVKKSTYLDVSYNLSCGKCDDLKYGDVINLNISINMKNSLKKNQNSNELIININKIPAVKITYSTRKPFYCPANLIKNHSFFKEKTNSSVENIEECNILWNYTKNIYEVEKEINSCIDFENNKTKICSGKGVCNSGNCNCLNNEYSIGAFYGKFCECSDFTCPKFENEFCGGVSRGFCKCNQCICDKRFYGNDCSIKNCDSENWQLDCMINDTLCNKRGKCKCGKCKCEDHFTGDKCQHEINTHPDCSIHKKCMECYIEIRGNCSEVCEKYSIMHTDIKINEYFCEYMTSHGCTLRYMQVMNEPLILMDDFNQNLNCTRKSYSYLIGFTVAGAIVLILGIIIMLFFCIKYISEKRSLIIFEYEKNISSWIRVLKIFDFQGENPIYKRFRKPPTAEKPPPVTENA